jgi:SAM-dependent methyltransferase
VHAVTRVRRVEPELLDALACDDPRARRSRRDLRRINLVMATMSIVLPALDRVATSPPRSMLELGCGDGSLMLRLARRRAARWPGIAVTLLDRQPVVPNRRLDALRALGWEPQLVTADVFEWLAGSERSRWDVVFANLVIHHFSAERLRELFAAVAQRTDALICCEPRRDVLALAGSRLIGLIGAGAVTRHDAVASVHAGFCGTELSALWPVGTDWRLHEYRAGLFSHCFCATRGTRVDGTRVGSGTGDGSDVSGGTRVPRVVDIHAATRAAHPRDAHGNDAPGRRS